MDMDEKAVVKIDAEGGLVSCAKELAAGDCGYEKGEKVCGRCGAMAVQQKLTYSTPQEKHLVEYLDSLSDEDLDKEFPESSDYDEIDSKVVFDVGGAFLRRALTNRRRRRRKSVEGDVVSIKGEEEESYVEDEDLLSDEEKGMLRALRRRMQKMGENGEMYEDEDILDEDEKGMFRMLRRRMRRKQMMTPEGEVPAPVPMPAPAENTEAPEPVEDEDDKDDKTICPKCSYKNSKNARFCSQCGTKLMANESDDEEMSDEKMGMGSSMGSSMGGGSEMEQMAEEEMEKRRRAREMRMQSMGVKSADWDEEAYVCGFQKKMLPGNSVPCVACPGGCAPEQGLPTLIEVEGLAEGTFGGKILASGYSDIKDSFVVQVKRDDVIIEAIFDGQDARCKGWRELDSDQIDVKSADSPKAIISFEEAAQIAVKSIEGEIVSIDADEFEGNESYAVEISGADGNSYDVYVSLDGQILGYDTYDAVEALEIEAEIAEIALKRAYGIEARQEMAEAGEAMPDGSFPIKDEADLRNAIQAHGRAKDIDAAKAHIKKRAKDLGLEELLPEEWSSGEKSVTVADDPELLAKLLEFELMALDEETDLDN